jgi:hypothetical protein
LHFSSTSRKVAGMGARSSRLVAFRLTLERARAAGAPFDEAWAAALRALPHSYEGDTLRKVLPDTREAWARAWAGEPPTSGDLACVALLEPLAEDPLEPAGRLGTLVA